MIIIWQKIPRSQEIFCVCLFACSVIMPISKVVEEKQRACLFVCVFVWLCVCLHLNVIPFVVWGKKLLICWEEEEIKRFPGLLTNHFHSLFFISPHASTFVFFVNWHSISQIDQDVFLRYCHLYLSESENHISLFQNVSICLANQGPPILITLINCVMKN